MLISRYLDEPCPTCDKEGMYGNINVVENELNRGCNNCGFQFTVSLPEIRKKIIYLDQFFLSHAFRNQETPFVDAANRIKDMAGRQLIVCPYSSVHTDETHLWRHQKQKNLYEFIKQTALGHKFNQAYEIQQIQMQRAFEAFRTDTHPLEQIQERDAFRKNIHQWNDYLWIDVAPYLGNVESMRKGKTTAIELLVDLFPEWSKSTSTFEEDVNMEARGYGRSLLEQYLQMVVNVGTGNLINYLEAPIDTIYVESLLHFDSSTMDIDQRLKRIGTFFNSQYFFNIPYVQISCRLFAILRKKVKNGAYPNPVNARKKLSGLFYDSECISVFGPYCDAIFIDRAMKQWSEAPEARLLEPYNTEIFSVSNWEDFHQYLDQIEKNYSDEIREAINWIYPRADA